MNGKKENIQINKDCKFQFNCNFFLVERSNQAKELLWTLEYISPLINKNEKRAIDKERFIDNCVCLV